MRLVLGALVAILAVPVWTQERSPQAIAGQRFAQIDRLIAEAMAARQTPGAVVLIGRGDTVVFEKAYGQRAVVPSAEPMTLDTMFDLASLTKVVATTTAVMQLVEQGRVRLTDSVAAHIPGFERYGKNSITVRHLLTHVSGLRPDVDLHPWEGYHTAIDLAIAEVPTSAPGERFIYSDINFFLLGEIVARVSGMPLDQYTQRHIFEPLGMTDTGFNPPAAKRSRIAPTERCALTAGYPCNTPDVPHLRGIVHDPTSRRMGGVAGHAGVFGTARDLSRFVRMLLGGGRLGTTRVLSPATVAKITAPATPQHLASVRGLGWDIDTTFSSNRGELFPIGSYGHTGFTGTSIWVDPYTQGYVIFLSSRLHPDGKGDVTPLRARVATVAAAELARMDTGGPGPSIGLPPMTGRDFAVSSATGSSVTPSAPVLPGIDVLARDGFALLKGKRVGLVTNHTGRTADGASTIDLIHQAAGVQLAALFSPEHGIRGILDEDVPSSRDEQTGLPIHSLYGATRRPTDEMLAGLDTIVLDLQDVGSRFYTYAATLGYVMEEAAKKNIPVVVLDRPNPINGWQIEGPAADEPFVGFTAYVATMPIRHGMTLGELAMLFNDEKKIGASLTVVPVENWRRDFWYDETGLSWINPSPNMRNLNQATLYPGIGAIEYSNISVGRGTDQPFEQIGAPWIDGRALAARLNARVLPGVRFYPVAFTPAASKFANEACQGVFMVITNRAALQPVRVGLEVAGALWRLHGEDYRMENTDRLLGSTALLERVKAGEDPARVASSWSAAEAHWRLLRAKHLLYK
ncbi:MAG TPA: exo-beta-N-acetylmuramidase NamZ domain-containing protein [Vicinamibacterales bacterium]|nr:exo-beta-N-acetylmuramidase NamZ domain-containing protein [Vicinamibacterales bacterium]